MKARFLSSWTGVLVMAAIAGGGALAWRSPEVRARAMAVFKAGDAASVVLMMNRHWTDSATAHASFTIINESNRAVGEVIVICRALDQQGKTLNSTRKRVNAEPIAAGAREAYELAVDAAGLPMTSMNCEVESAR